MTEEEKQKLIDEAVKSAQGKDITENDKVQSDR